MGKPFFVTKEWFPHTPSKKVIRENYILSFRYLVSPCSAGIFVCSFTNFNQSPPKENVGKARGGNQAL